MKKSKLLLLFIFSFCFSLHSFCQTEEVKVIDKYYKLTIDVELQECDDEGQTTTFLKKAIDAGAKFTIYKQTKDKESYVIKFWEWIPYNEAVKKLTGTNSMAFIKKSPSAKLLKDAIILDPKTIEEKAAAYNFYYESDSTLKVRYFLLPKSDIVFQAEIIKAFFQPVAGTAVLPFKFRSQKSEFNKDITLSSLVGLKHSFNNNFSLGVVTGIGISSVTVDSASTNGYTKKSADLAAVSMPLGFVLDYKGLQLGLFMGWDWISKNSEYKWNFQGKHWLAIGLGISIFKNEFAKKGEEGKN